MPQPIVIKDLSGLAEGISSAGGALGGALAQRAQRQQEEQQKEFQAQSLATTLNISLEQAKGIAKESPQVQAALIQGFQQQEEGQRNANERKMIQDELNGPQLQAGEGLEISDKGFFPGVSKEPSVSEKVLGGDQGFSETIDLNYSDGTAASSELKLDAYERSSPMRKLNKESEKLDKEEDLTRKSFLGAKEREIELKGIDNKRKAIQTKKDKFSKASKSTEKRFELMAERADKAFRGDGRRSELRRLITEENVGLAGDEFAFMNPANLFQKGRIKTLGVTAGEEKFQNLMLEEVRESFPTLPRIKSEFDFIISRFPGVLRTKEGMLSMLDMYDQAASLNKDSEVLREQFDKMGVPINEIPNLINSQIGQREEVLMKKLRTLRDAKQYAGSEIASESVDEIIMGTR